MHSTAQPPTIELIGAAADEVGVHSSDQLADHVRRGRLLRVRRGVYVRVESWVEAPPWRRHEIAAAAEAQRYDPLFCRETALLIHRLPVLNLPGTVFVRTAGRGRVSTQPRSSMTGQLTASQFIRRRAERGPGDESIAVAALRNIPKKYVEPALPAGVSRTEFRAATAGGDRALPEVLRSAESLQGICGPLKGYRVEPVGLAVVDTVSRLPFADAVVVLDAVKARRNIDVIPWLGYLRTGRQRRRWERAWEFADPRAESALESESRATLNQLGFPPPTLQRTVQTRIGTFRLDMCWEDERVIGEIDGRGKYLDPHLTSGRDAYEIHYAEKQRREALEEDGWHMARWGKEQIRDPAQLVRRLGRCGLVPRSAGAIPGGHRGVA